VSHTGAAGLTLGGGQGRLQRIYGLACDNLRAAEVITAKGDFLKADEKENPDLFWALRGGGGNFGVVTALEYELHPFGGTVLGGGIVYPLEQAREVYKFYAEFTQKIPDQLYLGVTLASPDGSKPVVAVDACYAGDLKEGERVLAPLRAFGKPVADEIKARPYRDLQTGDDVGLGWGKNYYVKSGYVHELTPALFDVILEKFQGSPQRVTAVGIDQFGGAMSRVPENATAYPGRKAAYELLLITAWGDPARNDENLAAARDYWEKLSAFTKGFYINIVGGEEQDKLRANWGGNYDRLVRVKTKYDPTNLFRLNPNIRPLGT
jgi:FAD/FMN-containing dehydrogenase